MRDPEYLRDLNRFHGEACLHTYAGGGGKTGAQRPGFCELEYREGDWYYRDSYAGFLRSAGQETIYFRDNPVWICLYGGGMEPEFSRPDYAARTFEFLKQALSAGDKIKIFQPRGPESFGAGEWRYSSEMNGDIAGFDGREKILHDGKPVFRHRFFGGLIIDGQA